MKIESNVFLFNHVILEEYKSLQMKAAIPLVSGGQRWMHNLFLLWPEEDYRLSWTKLLQLPVSQTYLDKIRFWQHMHIHVHQRITLVIFGIVSLHLYIYRPRSKGDNVLDSIRPSIFMLNRWIRSFSHYMHKWSSELISLYECTFHMWKYVKCGYIDDVVWKL